MRKGVIVGVRVAHDRATVDQIERATGDDQRTTVKTLLANEGITEAFSLQTCYRMEAYVVAPNTNTGWEALAPLIAAVDDEVVVRMGHEESMRHLLRVAAGLESVVLGEDQILGQVRRAREAANAVDGLKEILDEAIQKAIRVGERARTETAINEGTLSHGTTAVELVAREQSLDACRALVIGAGEMGSLAAAALADSAVAGVHVANRTLENAEEVVDDLEIAGTSHDLSEVPTLLERCDILISTTDSKDPVVTANMLADAGNTIIVDLTHPRDVELAAGDIPEVTLYDLDDLETITSTNLDRREAARETVETMIDEEFERLLDAFKRKQADAVIAAMYETSERIKRRELERGIARLETDGSLDPDEREILESMTGAIINQLLAAPTKSLREAAVRDDWTTINTALQLFDPEMDNIVPAEWHSNVTRRTAEHADD